MQSRAFQALCFDLDQTLLDGSQFYQAILGTCAAVAELAPNLEASQVAEANGGVFFQIDPETIDDWTLGRLTGRELGLRTWGETLRACGHADESLISFAVSTHLRLARKTYRMFEDARALVDAVTRAGIPVALITNGASDTQREKLDSLGLLDWFDVLVISRDTGVAKPDIGAFQCATDRLGVVGKACWHIGDNLVADVGGAQTAGLTGVWLNRQNELPLGGIKPDLKIQSLSELVTLLID